MTLAFEHPLPTTRRRPRRLARVVGAAALFGATAATANLVVDTFAAPPARPAEPWLDPVEVEFITQGPAPA